MTDQIFDKIKSEMDPLKKILAVIPGFQGIHGTSGARNSDKLLRDTIAKRFEAQFGHVSGLQRDLINQGEIDKIDDLEAAAIHLRTFADRVRRATRGYSGLFDAVKINEKELARLYLRCYHAATLR